MTCNVVKDLLPLYVDECCSDESAQLVLDHIEGCEECRREYELMRKSVTKKETPAPTKKPFKRINQWKASLIQSLMMFLAFAVIIPGVVLEGGTPYGQTNGLWAVALIVPATGFMLSLANWNFIRVYKNRKTFSNSSLLVTVGFIMIAYTWAALHYQMNIDFASPLVLCGLGLSLVFCVVSKVLSSYYALLLGRE